MRVVQFLQQQVHRRNRRLDLVQPQRIVIEHLAHAAVGGRCDAAFLIVYCLDQILVVLLEQIFRRRQSVEAEHDAVIQVAEQPVPLIEQREVGANKQQRDENAQQQRIPDGFRRQVVQAEYEREYASAKGDEKQSFAMVAQVFSKRTRKQPHTPSLPGIEYPTPFFVAIKSASPAASSLRRRRLTFTVSVLSSI